MGSGAFGGCPAGSGVVGVRREGALGVPLEGGIEARENLAYAHNVGRDKREGDVHGGGAIGEGADGQRPVFPLRGVEVAVQVDVAKFFPGGG